MNLYPVLETPELLAKWFVSPSLPQERINDLHTRMQAESYIAYLGMLGFELPNPKKVKTPMLVIGGKNDTLFSIKDVKNTAQRYRTQAQIVDTAHDIMLEENWQHAADHILSWLSRWNL